ncbi:YraN family protein [Salinarimonas chemoclinalis]|uniref:YraN family protein n=1 Tax=Salinarimonas chemoclinalis TaxID=3241599 RepID=UPI00355645D9
MRSAPGEASGAARRRRALAHGAFAEWRALAALMLKGWRPIARRWRVPGGEIDLVMRRGRIVLFVEVKARAALDDARVAVTPQKRRRLARAIRAWRSRNRWADTGWSFRVDAVFLGRGRWPEHVEGVMEI